MKFQTKNLKFLMLKYCHVSRFRVFCSKRHILSKGHIKLWGHPVFFFLLSGKMCEKFIVLCMEKSQDYKFKLFFCTKNTYIWSEALKNYYI